MHISVPLHRTEEEFIDIKNSVTWFQRAQANLQSHSLISEANKAIIERFLRDAALGKTLPGRAKKKIGPARLSSYILHLSLLCTNTSKDLASLTQEDMECFIEALENNRLTAYRWSSRAPSSLPRKTTPYSPRYILEIKITIRKFYKWLLGNNKIFPPIVEWIDTMKQEKEISALTEHEVTALILVTNTILGRALIQVLFDGGFRLGELLNIRLRHLTFKPIDPETASERCFMIRVPFSKTLRRTVVLPMPMSRDLLQLWLRLHPARPVLQADGTLGECDTHAPLFPVQPDTPRNILSKAGRKSLNKHVHPHLMRHSSATYWCTKLPYFQFCKRFGWTMTSRMPQRYIDREGIDDLESARIYRRQQERVQESQRRNQESFLGARAPEAPAHPGFTTPQRGARTDTLNNQQPPFIPQSGGVTHDTKVSSYEGNAQRRQRQLRDAPGHPGHHHATQPGQGARLRGQRLR